MTFKKIDLMTIVSILMTAVFIFFLPYMVETVKRSTEHCTIKNQIGNECKPVMF